MSKRSVSVSTFTPVAIADTTNLTDDDYFALIQGGSATQRLNFLEIFLGGQASASAPSIMVFGRDSTVGATVTAGAELREGPLQAAVADLAAPPVFGRNATTPPQRSATDGHLLNLSFNAFGGIIRWLAAPGEELTTVGNTAPLGEMSLSAFTGGSPGLMGGHIIYEPV